MENNRDALLQAIDSIKKSGIAKGVIINDEDIARKAGISEKQLNAYLNGREEIPADLVSKLMPAHSPRIVMVRFTEEIDLPDPSEDEFDAAENNRMSLEATVSMIKALGKSKGISITEEDMAQKTGISMEQLHTYLKGEDQTPANLTGSLLSAYQNLLETARLENNRESLKRDIVWIRNCGLAKGMDITLEEMALKISISPEQLYGFLDGKHEIQDDLLPKLTAAYAPLLHNVTQVEMIEDINKIMKK